MSYKDYLVPVDEACADAQAKGLTVVEATNRDLFVDLDSKAALAIFKARVRGLEKKGIATGHRITVSKSGKWHGYVSLSKPLSLGGRVALQCVLGSDLTHEYLTLLKAWEEGEGTRIVFFEVKKDEAAA